MIRVGFIVQCRHIWDKQEPVYLEMKKRSNFEPMLIVVPDFDFSNFVLNRDYSDEWLFFRNRYAEDIVIKAVDENGNIIDLKQLDLDYLFYPRPYDHYLPEELRSTSVSEVCRRCYIPYSTADLQDIEDGLISGGWYENMDLYFAESENVCGKMIKEKNTLTDERITFLGYPVYDTIFKSQQCDEHVCKKVLWTPRWSYDSSIGGSHFIEYCESFVEYSIKDKERRVYFRPHPLMFDNFIRIGMMTSYQAERLKQTLNRAFVMDYHEMVLDTFNEVDVLISDISSLIPMFFFTGKPIVFCPKDQNAYSEGFKYYIPGLYFAKSWNEIETCLERILEGDDPLYDTRKKMISEAISQHKDSAIKIADRIIEDFNRRVETN